MELRQSARSREPEGGGLVEAGLRELKNGPGRREGAEIGSQIERGKGCRVQYQESKWREGS
eukprot:3932522-Rhodomonas_salina.1